MKRTNLILLLFAWVCLIAVSCEKEYPAENETIESDDELLKSLADDSTLEIAPDISITDSILQDHASVSQCREHLLSYTYDRWNRLDRISYITRNAVISTANSDRFPGFIHMQDKFIYSNDGRLSQLIRYRMFEKPGICRPELTKTYTYNASEQLVKIITKRADLTNIWNKVEYLSYDNRGNMVKRVVTIASIRASWYEYIYDRSDRLVRIIGYMAPMPVVSNAETDATKFIRFICDIHYDVQNNIERKDFYYPFRQTTSVNDVTRNWSVYYKYDEGNNPFHDLKLPVSSLLEWMDVISPSNISAISFDNGTIERSVFYSYRYNNLMYPVLRYRINAEAFNE